jgi:hypothetical protein
MIINKLIHHAKKTSTGYCSLWITKLGTTDLDTAWSLAGKLYNDETTIYFLPSGQIKHGSMINDWDDLPAKTRLIVGYKGTYRIDKDRTAFRIAGFKYKDQKTVYYLPSNKLLSGKEIRDFSQLPIFQSELIYFLLPHFNNSIPLSNLEPT